MFDVKFQNIIPKICLCFYGLFDHVFEFTMVKVGIEYTCLQIHAVEINKMEEVHTALFGKVYRTIFQSKIRQLVFKTFEMIFKQITQKYSYIFTYIYICYKI